MPLQPEDTANSKARRVGLAVKPESVSAWLRTSWLFAGVADDLLAQVAAITRWITFASGAFICRRDDPGQDLYLIVEGKVLVRQGERVLASLESGELIGELAVLDGQPRSADLVAVEPTRVLEIRGADFEALLGRQHELARRLLQLLARRVRSAGQQQSRVEQLVRSYRERGHVMARLDPLEAETAARPRELTLEYHGLDHRDLRLFYPVVLGDGVKRWPLQQILDHLETCYCGAIGWQYTHIDDPRIQGWLRERIEDNAWQQPLERDAQLRILAKLTDAEEFEVFLQRVFSGAKRFSLEGAETLLPLLTRALDEAAKHGVREVVLGMAHRGRLNVLANILGKPAVQIFREFQDSAQDQGYGGSDVKYHKGYEAAIQTGAGERLQLSLCFNPSHLEFVAPVVLGRTRARQDRAGDSQGNHVLPLVIHGDAAFAGQGIVQELFNLSALPGYSTGGAVHVILNNQIGFTTTPPAGRSTRYATDIARMLQIPVVHVNGENPEAVDRAISLAVAFRASFHLDVVIDMYCYRRRGHNENDDPSFTQPLLYRRIAALRPVRAAYIDNLLKLGVLSREEAEHVAQRSRQRLHEALQQTHNAGPADQAARPIRDCAAAQTSCRDGDRDGSADTVITALPAERVAWLIERMTALPAGFTPHPRVKRMLAARRAMAGGKRPLDWATAEALAFASLLADNRPVRLSGQDSERGTYAQRHSALYDYASGERYVPLAHLAPQQGAFSVYNSPLSETGVLGFDFGYSLDRPEGLVIWEAQFGDFCNVAQVIVDQFIAACEMKWECRSGLCLMLPHGFEGQGPEHSSARLERFLQLAAQDNIQIVNLSSAAQLFHCLRRQVLGERRKPLVILSPKSQLLHPCASSPLTDLYDSEFHPVLPDAERIERQSCRRILLSGGKIYHELARERSRRGRTDIVLIRLEQYYPFPERALLAALAQWPATADLVWVQEEPANMGAWPFLQQHLGGLPEGDGKRSLACIARAPSASPATGSKAVHELEQNRLLERALNEKLVNRGGFSFSGNFFSKEYEKP